MGIEENKIVVKCDGCDIYILDSLESLGIKLIGGRGTEEIVCLDCFKKILAIKS